jgi:F420-dependent oxidoreductase-like protein
MTRQLSMYGGDMRLGLALGYWGRGPAADHASRALEAERLGYHSVWTAESWGSDAFTPLTWIAARTSRIGLGTAVAQMAARSPTTTAMHALTLDHLSGGRLMLGLGLSGPQVVEGWYGRPFPASPLTATREYVDVVRQVLRREAPVALDGRFHPLPYPGPDGTGLGKALKPITHPLRADLPILLGAEGPKNVALAAEIADGWIPLYYSPFRPEVYGTLGDTKPGFEVCVTVMGCAITDDIETALAPTKASLGFYIGGMGARDRNFHMELMSRMGFEAEAHKIQELFFEGRRDEAIALVPTQFADEVSLVGSKERIRDRLQAWEESAVTTMIVHGDLDTMRALAEIAC